MTAIDIVRFEQRLLRSSAGLGDAYEADTCIVCASFCVNRPDFSRDSMTGFWPAAAFRRSPFSAKSCLSLSAIFDSWLPATAAVKMLRDDHSTSNRPSLFDRARLVKALSLFA